MLLQIVSQSLGDGGGDSSGNLGVTEFGFGLTLELGFHDLDRDHCGQTLAEVVARNLDFALLKELVVLGIFL